MKYLNQIKQKWQVAAGLLAVTSIFHSAQAASVVSAGALENDFYVAVLFDEPVDPTSAVDVSKYTISDSTVSFVTLRSDRIAELALFAPVAEGFTATVNGVQTVDGDSISGTVTGKLSSMIPSDLGFPTTLGRGLHTGNGFWITAGGSDIWGTGDNGYFLHTQHTGSFDVRVKVESLVEGDEWAKAGLMVRSSMDTGARNQMILITKNGTYPPYRDGGMNLYNHQWRDAEYGSSASTPDAQRIRPTVFPSWLRLVRETATSREIKSYVSFDGEEWQLLNSHAFPEDFPETALVGLAVTAHDDDQTVTPLAEALFSEFELNVAGFEDQEGPMVVSATGTSDRNTVTIVFSEAVDPATATAVANYSLSPALSLSNGRITLPDTVVFDTALQTEGQDYTITINNVKDASPQGNLIAANSEVSFRAWLLSSGFLRADFFTGISGTPIVNLTTAQKFIDNQPDDTRFLPNADTPNGYGDNYGLRVSGWLVPEVSGDYHFFIRSDDASQLFINELGEEIPDPVASLPKAEETDCCDAFAEPSTMNTDGFTSPTTLTPITLTAGERYGFVFLVKEGTGGDWGQVAWRREGDTTAAADLAPISGEFFETFVDGTGASLAITAHPEGITVRQNRSATFSVAVEASTTSVGYQWLKDGEAIPGATTATYTIDSATPADDGSEYSVRVRIPGASVTSEIATLTVNTDDIPPTVLSAGAFEGASTVGVAFDEPLDEVSATTIANYEVSGATVTAATLHIGRVVELTLSGPVTAGFTVTVSNVEDVLENVLTTATVNGQFSDLTPQDLGTPGTDPVELGRAFTWGTGYFIGAGGNDLWDVDDAGYIVHREFTGPFDMRVRVESLLNGDEWAKVGLMARESLDPGSRNEMVGITKPAPQINPATPLEPHIGGVNVYVHQWRETTGGSSASKPSGERRSPTVFPSWLRLVRESIESNEIQSYISYDGEEWIAYHTHTIPGDLLPETLVLGIASTSHDNAAGFPLAESLVDHFSITSPGGTGEDPNLNVIVEAGGGLVISWETGTLVAAPSVAGPYEPVTGASNPYTVTPSGTAMFYQVQVSP